MSQAVTFAAVCSLSPKSRISCAIFYGGKLRSPSISGPDIERDVMNGLVYFFFAFDQSLEVQMAT